MAARRLPSPASIAGLGCLMLAALAVGAAAGRDPLLCGVLLLGGAVALASLMDLTLGVALYVFMIAGGFLGRYPTVTALLSGLLLLSWLLGASSSSGQRPNLLTERPGVLLAAAGFLVWIALSIAWAKDISVALDSFYRYVPGVLSFVFVFAALRTTRDFAMVAAAWVLGGAVAAIAGLATQGLTGRLGGIAGDPNILGAVLIPGAAFGVAACSVMNRRRPGRWTLVAVATCLCLVGVLLTASRGALFALAACLVLSVIVGGPWRGRALLVAVAAVIFGLGFFTLVAGQAARDHLSNDNQGSGRTSIWRVANRMIADNPVAGVGAGNFRQASISYVVRPGSLDRSDLIVGRPSVAHNTFLHIAAEEGLVGASLFMIVMALGLAGYWSAVRAARRAGARSLELAARAGIVGAVGLLVAAVFISFQHARPLWLVLALGPGLASVARKAEHEAHW